MAQTVTTEEQVPFGFHGLDRLSNEDHAFAADLCVAKCHDHPDDQHRVLLQRSFVPPKKNCDTVQYNYALLTPESIFVPIAKQSIRHVPVAKKPKSETTNSASKPSSEPSQSSSEEKTTDDSAVVDEQRTSLSDLRSQYWELLKLHNKQLDHEAKVSLALLSQKAKEMTVSREESEVKEKIASLLGKISVISMDFALVAVDSCLFSCIYVFPCVPTHGRSFGYGCGQGSVDVCVLTSLICFV